MLTDPSPFILRAVVCPGYGSSYREKHNAVCFCHSAMWLFHYCKPTRCPGHMAVQVLLFGSSAGILLNWWVVCRSTEYRRLFTFFVWIDDMWRLMWPCTFLSFFSISSSSGSEARPSQWLSRQSAHSPHSDSEKRSQWSYSGDGISRTQDIRTKQWVSTCRSSDINQWHFYISIAEYLHKMLINISCHSVSPNKNTQ